MKYTAPIPASFDYLKPAIAAHMPQAFAWFECHSEAHILEWAKGEGDCWIWDHNDRKVNGWQEMIVERYASLLSRTTPAVDDLRTEEPFLPDDAMQQFEVTLPAPNASSPQQPPKVLWGCADNIAQVLSAYPGAVVRSVPDIPLSPLAIDFDLRADRSHAPAEPVAESSSLSNTLAFNYLALRQGVELPDTVWQRLSNPAHCATTDDPAGTLYVFDAAFPPLHGPGILSAESRDLLAAETALQQFIETLSPTDFLFVRCGAAVSRRGTWGGHPFGANPAVGDINKTYAEQVRGIQPATNDDRSARSPSL